MRKFCLHLHMTAFKHLKTVKYRQARTDASVHQRFLLHKHMILSCYTCMECIMLLCYRRTWMMTVDQIDCFSVLAAAAYAQWVLQTYPTFMQPCAQSAVHEAASEQAVTSVHTFFSFFTFLAVPSVLGVAASADPLTAGAALSGAPPEVEGSATSMGAAPPPSSVSAAYMTHGQI